MAEHQRERNKGRGGSRLMRQEQIYLGWCVPAEHPRGYWGEENVTLSQNEITLWCQIWAFLSNPCTALLIIPICCSPTLCLWLSLTLIHSVYLTCAFHLYSSFVCLWQKNHFHTRWTWSVTHHFFWRLLVIRVRLKAQQPSSTPCINKDLSGSSSPFFIRLVSHFSNTLSLTMTLKLLKSFLSAAVGKRHRGQRTIQTHIRTQGQFRNTSLAIPQIKSPALRQQSTTVPHLLHNYYISPFSKLRPFIIYHLVWGKILCMCQLKLLWEKSLLVGQEPFPRAVCQRRLIGGVWSLSWIILIVR